MNHQEYIRVVPGAQTAVMMIHSILGTPRHFDMLIPLVPENWSVYNILLDGHGKTLDDFAASSMKKWKKQVWQLFAELSVRYDRVVIAAHSMGTLFAIGLGLEYPEKIPFLFLLASPMKVGLRICGIVNAMKVVFQIIDETNPLEVATRNAYSLQPDWRLWKYVKWIPRFLELFSEIRAVRKLLPGLQVPCYAFQSRRDELVSNRTGRVLEECSRVNVQYLARSGHFYYNKEDKMRLLDAFSRICGQT